MKNALKGLASVNADLVRGRIVFLENSDISSLSPEQVPEQVNLLRHFSTAVMNTFERAEHTSFKLPRLGSEPVMVLFIFYFSSLKR
jgi:hypothetical protein